MDIIAYYLFYVPDGIIYSTRLVDMIVIVYFRIILHFIYTMHRMKVRETS